MGVVFNKFQGWWWHLRSFYARSNTILRKFHYCSIDVKLLLLQAYCLPSYCSHHWIRYKKSTYTKLRVAYNKVYRRILGYTRRDSASEMFVSNSLQNFDALFRKNVHNFHCRVQYIGNILVKVVYNTITLVNNAMWIKWMSTLQTNYPCVWYLVLLIYGIFPEINVLCLIMSYVLLFKQFINVGWFSIASRFSGTDASPICITFPDIWFE